MMMANSQSLTQDGVTILPWRNAINSHQRDIMKMVEALMDMLLLL